MHVSSRAMHLPESVVQHYFKALPELWGGRVVEIELIRTRWSGQSLILVLCCFYLLSLADYRKSIIFNSIGWES